MNETCVKHVLSSYSYMNLLQMYTEAIFRSEIDNDQL